MKKIISFISLFFVGFLYLHSQNAFYCAGSNDQITFGNLASVYIFGGLNCSSNTSGEVQIPVGGKVYVDGSFDSSETFVIKNSGNNSATGQLIIKDDVAATGTVTVERLFENADFPTLSFPFNGYTIANFESDITGQVSSLPLAAITESSCLPNQGCFARYDSSIFFYNNTRHLNSHMTSDGGPFVPYLRYSMNDTNSNDRVNPIDGIKGKFLDLRGVPQNAVISVPLTNNSATFDYWGRNYHFEFNKDIIRDVFSGLPSVDTDYGDNLFILANPYTSHIDLSTIGINEVVSGLVESDGMTFGNRLTGVSILTASQIDDRGRTISSSVSFNQTATDGVTGAFVAGSADLIVRPHGDFWMKFNSANMLAAENFIYSDGIKTFLTQGNTLNYKSAGGNPFPNARMAKKSNKSDNKTYQISLSLVNDNENKSLGVAYVYTNNYVESGVLHSSEFKYHNTDSPYIYTLEESANGKAKYYGEGVSTPRLIINGVKRDFYSKAIPLGVNTNGLNDKLLIELSKMSENLIPVDKFSSNDVNFYFHDIQADKYIDIKKGFSYEVDAEGVVDNRYEIYLSEKPLSILLENGVEIGYTTKVYKAEDNVVGISFDQNQFNGSLADVYIYNALGQIVNITEDVDTSLKFVNILLPGAKISEFFVVNIIAENGIAVSQKIVL